MTETRHTSAVPAQLATSAKKFPIRRYGMLSKPSLSDAHRGITISARTSNFSLQSVRHAHALDTRRHQWRHRR
jgi:hypothetical protein